MLPHRLLPTSKTKTTSEYPPFRYRIWVFLATAVIVAYCGKVGQAKKLAQNKNALDRRGRGGV